MRSIALAIAAVLAPTLAVAGDDETPPPPVFLEKVEATSTYASKNNAYEARLAVNPKIAYDSNYDPIYKSAWCEGKKDAGIGESLTLTFAAPTRVDKLTIKAGVWMTAKLFTANNIPTAITITTDDKRTFTAKPSATERKEAEVAIGGAPVKTMTLAITEVKPGKMNDSCITHVAFGDAAVVTGVDAAGAAAYAGAAKAIADTFWVFSGDTVAVGCDPKLIAKTIELPFTWVDVVNTHSSDEKTRFTRTKGVIKDAAAFTKYCKRGFFNAGHSVEKAQVSSSGPGLVSLQFEGAETMQSLQLRYKGGVWKAFALD